jgi:hypothetical protein
MTQNMFLSRIIINMLSVKCSPQLVPTSSHVSLSYAFLKEYDLKSYFS